MIKSTKSVWDASESVACKSYLLLNKVSPKFQHKIIIIISHSMNIENLDSCVVLTSEGCTIWNGVEIFF